MGEIQHDFYKNHTEFYQVSLKNLPHLTNFSPQLMACMGRVSSKSFYLPQLFTLLINFFFSITHQNSIQFSFLEDHHDYVNNWWQQHLLRNHKGNECTNEKLWSYRKLMWASTWQNQQNMCVPSEDSDQPGHPPCLIRVFAVRLMCSLGPQLSSSGQRRLWSDWVDAQADLSSLGTHVILLVLSWCGSFGLFHTVKWMTQKHTEMLISRAFGNTSDFRVDERLIFLPTAREQVCCLASSYPPYKCIREYGKSVPIDV